MQRVACKDWAEVSCLLANLVAELEQPCRECGEADRLVLTGRSPTGADVTVRVMPDLVLEVEGGEALLETIRARGCPHGG